MLQQDKQQIHYQYIVMLPFAVVFMTYPYGENLSPNFCCSHQVVPYGLF